jgi:hypothetical protein
MGMLLYNFVPPVAGWIEADLWTRCLWILGSVTGGVIVYSAVLFTVGLRPAALRMTSPGSTL